MTTVSKPINTLQVSLERLGWSIIAAEFDLSREAARIEIKRFDGLLITFDARNGRASITREIIERRTRFIKQVKGGYMAERIEPRFIGRDTRSGARSGLRWLCNYIADNCDGKATAVDVRRMFSLVMDGRRHAIAA